MPIEDTIWELEPHTKAKHEILRNYLGAWFPILASRYTRIVYVDGFAGPGIYKGGEDGSPLIALKVACNHTLLPRFRDEVVFLFIEMDKDRAQVLEKQLSSVKIPEKFRVSVECNDFESCISSILDDISERGKMMAPSFFFIDPFGPTGFSMKLIEKISKQKRSEILINFSYQSLNQWFLSNPSKHGNVNILFGNENWKEALKFESKEKEEFLRREYQSSLENLGWRVRPFCMINKHNHTQYYLFFATKHFLGMSAMKNAMWKSAPIGDFKYSDLSNPAQPNMLEKEFESQYITELAEYIYELYKGVSASKEVLVEELAWHPVCIERHLTGALKLLENENPPRIIAVENRRRKGSYPNGCIISFSN